MTTIVSRFGSSLVGRRWLFPAEKTMASVAVAAGTVNLFLIWYKNAQVDWAGYSSILILVGGLLCLGFFYRLSGRSERIGAAIICAALFIFFTLCLSVFNYLLLPLVREPIDINLNAIDRIFGYSWPAVMEWASRHPVINEIIRYAYLSTMPQFAAIVVILGLTGRVKQLHVLIVAVTITATFTIAFWGIFPSGGAVVLFDLPPSIEVLVNPLVGTAYGREMLYMAENGPGLISPDNIKGLVGFPSYHIVLAAIAVYSARGIKWIFPFYLVLNLLIVPGIFIQGGHHLVDLPAGLLVAFAGLYLAHRAVSEQYRKYRLPELLEN